MNAQGDLAAVMTFAGGLPMEAIRVQIRGQRAQDRLDIAILQHLAPVGTGHGARSLP